VISRHDLIEIAKDVAIASSLCTAILLPVFIADHINTQRMHPVLQKQ